MGTINLERLAAETAEKIWHDVGDRANVDIDVDDETKREILEIWTGIIEKALAYAVRGKPCVTYNRQPL